MVGEYQHGVCTYYGACRIDNSDYMYQGGCEDLSNWGENKIKHGEQPCQVWNGSTSARIYGVCKNGDCIR